MPEPSVPAHPATDHVVLIGMPGVGKSTVGPLVARALSREHVDTDEQVCAATGRSIAQLFGTDGESAFRAEEAQVVEATLAREPAAVISVGAGALADPSTRWLVGRGGPVVWLRADPATLVQRLQGVTDRPLLAAGPGQSLGDTLARLDEVRRPIYAGLADITVDVDGRDATEVAEAVLDGLGIRMRPR